MSIIGRRIDREGLNPGRTQQLIRYLLNPKKHKNPEMDQVKGERLLYFETGGLLSLTPDEIANEIDKITERARARDARVAEDPIEHFVFSWATGLHASQADVRKAVEVALDYLGMTHHQYIWAAHGDTDNAHVHLVLSRINPDNLRAATLAFPAQKAQQMGAVICNALGLSPAPNQPYRVMPDGKVERIANENSISLPPDVKAMEDATGTKSALRQAQEAVPAVVNQAQSWADIHSLLAKKGIRYERTGSGAIIFVGEIPVKASKAARAASLPKLEKRFGAFQPRDVLQAGFSEEDIRVAHQKEPLDRRMREYRWQEYIVLRDAHVAARRYETDQSRRRQERELAEHQAEYEVEKGHVAAAPPSPVRQALSSVVAANAAKRKAALKARHRAERLALRRRFPPFSSFIDWMDPTSREEWLNRKNQAEITADGPPRNIRIDDIRLYHPTIHGEMVYYAREGKPADFIDRGARIEVLGKHNEDAILAALQLAHAKWPSGLMLVGDAEFLDRAIRICVINEIPIADPVQKIRAEKIRVELNVSSPASHELQPTAAPAEIAKNAERNKPIQKKTPSRGRKPEGRER